MDTMTGAKTPAAPPSKAQLDGSSEMSTSEKRVIVFRLVVIFCLIATAAVCGYGAYYLTYTYEGKLGKSQFNSIATQFEAFVDDSLKGKVLALESQSNMVAMECPYASMWPNCSIPMNSYLNMTEPLSTMTKMRTLSFSMIVTPEQVAGFEEFAYDFYERDGYPHLGISSIGKGIYAVNATTKVRYHDTEGLQHGERHVLVPILQTGYLNLNRGTLMYNFYSEPTRSRTIDAVMNCVADIGISNKDCTSATDNIQLIQDATFRPAILIIHPVFPRFNSTVLTGFIQAVFNWDSVFISSLPTYVPTVDVVLSGGSETFTFRIGKGKLEYSTKGDKHQKRHEGRAHSFTVTSFRGSYIYTITIYPTDGFVDGYRTDNPWVMMGVAVAIIAFTSMFFFLYDVFINRTSVEKELRTAINTKRLFVRFISHEIRTPLNTVHVGLQLLTSEMSVFINADAHKNTPAAARVHDWMTLIEDIEESADTGILVLNDLINYDKISMGTLNADFELVSLWELVRITTTQHQVAARRTGVNLVLRLELDDAEIVPSRRAILQRLMIVGDKVKISQVIRNLVSNALKFSKQGDNVEVSMKWEEHGLPGILVPGELGEQFNRAPTPRVGDTTVCPSESQETSKRAGSLIMRVVDSGAGISKEDQISLFQEGKQFRANQLQAGQGSGLGLWISKGLTDLHNGSLTAFSEGEDKGAEFCLELPAILAGLNAQPPSKPALANADSYVSTGTSANAEDIKPFLSIATSTFTLAAPAEEQTRGALEVKKEVKKEVLLSSVETHDAVRSVFVVDDSGPSRKVLCRLLRNAGYNTYEAVDGEDCVTKMAQFIAEGVSIDMVFMDFEMPKMNGPDATQALRDMGVTIPVIGVTGNVLPADKEYFLNHGANAVLHKPLNINQLKEEIGRHNQVCATDGTQSAKKYQPSSSGEDKV